VNAEQDRRALRRFWLEADKEDTRYVLEEVRGLTALVEGWCLETENPLARSMYARVLDEGVENMILRLKSRG
jgi:hypothetical protein